MTEAKPLTLADLPDREQWEDRFWAKVEQSDGCWVWTGGYCHANNPDEGMRRPGFKLAGRMHYAPRIAYVLTIGDLPAGTLACHHCDNPKCVRPDHLFAGTHLDNTRDMIRKGRARWHRLPRRFGAANPAAKLTAFQAHRIRVRHAAGESRRSLAEFYEVSKSAIDRIVTGRSWAKEN